MGYFIQKDDKLNLIRFFFIKKKHNLKPFVTIKKIFNNIYYNNEVEKYGILEACGK